MSKMIRNLWSEDAGQDIAEYAVMLAVILVLVVGTVRLDRIERKQCVLQRSQFVAITRSPTRSVKIVSFANDTIYSRHAIFRFLPIYLGSGRGEAWSEDGPLRAT